MPKLSRRAQTRATSRITRSQRGHLTAITESDVVTVDPESPSPLSPIANSALPPTDRRPTHVSDSSSDSDTITLHHNSKMASQSKMAIVDQDAPSKVPILSAGEITPAVMREFEDACIGYFENKDIDEDKQVRKILAGLKDDRIKERLSVDRPRFQCLTFNAFMVEFCTAYLPENWEQDTRGEVLSLSQGTQTFWDFAITLQSKNALLSNTTSHLSKDKLRHQLEANMERRLAARCRHDKVDEIADFDKWLKHVKHVDDLLIAERKEVEAIMKAGRKSTRCSATLTEPSHHANAPSQNASASSSTTVRRFVRKLTEGEKKLLAEHEGCFKCRSFFITHRSNECPSGFPNATTYKTLTSKDVDAACRGSKAKPLASVSAHISDDENAPTVRPIAMVMGQALDPVAYVPSNHSSVIESEDNSASVSSSDANVSLHSPHFIAAIKTPTPVNTPDGGDTVPLLRAIVRSV
jgi:hypothetical protein